MTETENWRHSKPRPGSLPSDTPAIGELITAAFRAKGAEVLEHAQALRVVFAKG